MRKPTRKATTLVTEEFGKEHQIFIVPFFSDFGFKTVWVQGDKFPKKAIQGMLDLKDPIKELHMTRNEFSGLTWENKGGIFDVVCKDEHKRVFIVEMQSQDYRFIIQRLLYYTFQEFCNLIPKGPDETSYGALQPIYCICIIKDKILPGENYHQAFLLKNDQGNVLYSGLEIHLFELGKFPILPKEKKKVKSDLEKLLFTMKYAHTIDPKEKINIPDFWEEEWLSESITELELAKMTPEQRKWVERSLVKEGTIREARKVILEEMMQKGLEEGMEKGFKKGMEKGMEKGIEKGMEKGMEKSLETVVLSSHQKGLSIDLIASITNLSAERVKAIIDSHGKNPSI